MPVSLCKTEHRADSLANRSLPGGDRRRASRLPSERPLPTKSAQDERWRGQRILAKATNKTRKPRRKQGRPNKGAPVVGREVLIAATRELMKSMPPGQITRLDI